MKNTGREPPTETENLVVVIPDALRRDHWPDLPGTTFDVIASGPNTPNCIPTIVSGRRDHGVTWFADDPTSVPVVYDLEREGYDVAYWDNPNDRVRDITRAPDLKRLEDMEPPFVFVARLLWTHTPYGVQWDEHDESDEVIRRPDPGKPRAYPGVNSDWTTGHEYIAKMKAGGIDFVPDYEHAVEKTRERIMAWRDVLIDRGLSEDTTFIVEADHGEAWGGKIGVDGCSHEIHNTTGCDRVMKIAGTVLDRDLDVPEPFPQARTLGLWDERWLGGRADLDPIDRETDTDTDAAKQRLRDLGYLE